MCVPRCALLGLLLLVAHVNCQDGQTHTEQSVYKVVHNLDINFFRGLARYHARIPHAGWWSIRPNAGRATAVHPSHYHPVSHKVWPGGHVKRILGTVRGVVGACANEMV